MTYYMTEDQYKELRNLDGGICTECGAARVGDTEPDAEGYECEECGENAVQGIDNALISGTVDITDDAEKVTVEF